MRRVCKAKASDSYEVSQVTARKMKRETMTVKKATEATWALVKSFQETNQAVVQSIIAAQERTTQFGQSFFSEGMEILKANQAAAADIVAAQERNMQFTQRFFTEGMEVLKTNQAVSKNIAAIQERNMQFVQSFFRSEERRVGKEC